MKKTATLILPMLLFVLGFTSDNSKIKFDFESYWSYYNDFNFQMKARKNYKAALEAMALMKANGNERFPDMNDYLEEAICFVKTGDTTSAAKSLREAVVRGFINIDEDCGWARRELGEKLFVDLRPDLAKLKTEYYRRKSGTFDQLLEDRGRTSIDQFVRSEAVAGILSQEKRDELVHLADSINMTGFISSLRQHKMFIGSILIYHLYGENEKYVPVIDSCWQAELVNGTVSPKAYANWYDRQCVYVANEKQRYGTYIVFPEGQLGGPIRNIDSVDIYRKQIGLPPLWKDAEISGFDLPDAYKPIKK